MIYKKKERKSLMITVTKEIFTYLYTPAGFIDVTMWELL